MDHDHAIPIPPPAPPMAEIELPALINAATRKEHTELNRLILERLPLALPPSVANPEVLGRGLVVFARIYYTFESVWRELLSSEAGNGRVIEDELLQRLQELCIEELCRTKSLNDDIEHISRTTGRKVEETLRIRQQPLLEAMKRSLRANPHTLVAYAWVMYMALFSGGRWIRAQLESAGPHFWTNGSSRQTHEKGSPGYSFLQFDGEDDGESLKEEFKLRLKAVERLLGQEEKQHVVDAAKGLFEDCITLVGMLDADIRSNLTRRVWPWALMCAMVLMVVIWRFSYHNLVS